MKTILDAINEAAVATLAEDMVFPTVRDAAIQCDSVDVFMDKCKTDELVWLEENYIDDNGEVVGDVLKYNMINPVKGKIRTANTVAKRDELVSKGWVMTSTEWKSRTLLPAKYTSAKSTVKKAMEVGVIITSDMGKTAMSAATREQAAPKAVDFNAEAVKLAKKLADLAPNVDEAIWDTIVTDLKTAQIPF